jgi:hypothetical protein
MSQAPLDPGSQLSASGLGYVRFALANRALFRLIFSSDRPDFEDNGLRSAANAGYELLVGQVAKVTGTDPMTDRKVRRHVDAAWATAHGLADLLASGRLTDLAALPVDERDAAITQIVSRAVPTMPPAA